MFYLDFILTCLTIIEFSNLIIRIIKLTPDDVSELTDEMRSRLYS